MIVKGYKYIANTIVWNKHSYEAKVRERLGTPTSWRDILNVKFSDNRTITGSYISTEPTLVAGTRGTAYAYDDLALTEEVLTVDQYRNIPIFIDEADRAQQTYLDAMEIAEFQGEKINEFLESQMLAQHASWTDFGVTDLAGGAADDTSQITVSPSNVDDIIRATKRKANANNLVNKAVKHGRFIVWRAVDFEMLEAFVQANGFDTADMALKNEIPVEKAFHYMGVDHYLSNSHTANHVFAGVKNSGDLGILSSTWGKVKHIEDPAGPSDGGSTNALSGLGLPSRVDYGWDFPAQLTEGVMDVNVV